MSTLSPVTKLIVHKTGHGLGLDVHEDPYVMRKNHDLLESGMVITIEPGLYKQNSLGVRIEDDVVIEEDAFVGARAIVKAGTVVKANTIFAGRPANYFRDVKNEEADFFKMGQKVYEGFAADYIKELGAYKMQAKS